MDFLVVRKKENENNNALDKVARVNQAEDGFAVDLLGRVEVVLGRVVAAVVGGLKQERLFIPLHCEFKGRIDEKGS